MEGRGVRLPTPTSFLDALFDLRAHVSLWVTTPGLALTYIVQVIRRPPITGDSSFHVGESRNVCDRTADECSVTVSSYPELSADGCVS